MQKFFFLFVPCLSLLLIGCQEDFDHRLLREAKDFSQRHCPKEIEPGNRLDSACYDIESRTYTQWYTLMNSLDTPFAHRTSLENLDKVREHLNKELRGDTRWQSCKDNSINFCFVYRSASLQKELFRVTLTPEDYRR